MHIGIHTHFLKPGRIGGSETYTRSLIDALGRIDHDNEYFIFATPHNQSLFQSLPPNFHIISVNRFGKSIRDDSARLITSLTNRATVNRFGKSIRDLTNRATKYDLIHFPGTTIQPLSLPVPTVITIHDLQHLYWPGFFSLRERLRRWRQDRPSIHKAAHIIAISDYTRRTIIEKFPAAAGKVTTIHSGVSAEFFQTIPQPAQEQFRQKYNLPSTFALYPARPWPHKNHKRLLAAMNILREQHQSDCRLVLCGFTPDEMPSDWQPLLDSLEGDTVQLVSYIPKQEMPALYQTADLLIYPSLFEGFGLPILEAMAARCPVICANAAALPETAGEAAVLIDPFDSAAIAQAMHALLTNPTQRADLIEKGTRRAGMFSWAKTAEATLDIYQKESR